MMARKLKALGLALIAVFAISAIVASAAQAEELGTFTLEKYPGFIHATREQKLSAPDEYFQTGSGSKLACESIHYTSETLTGNETELTITPDYTDHTQGGNCKADNVLKVTITENGCDFRFYHLTTVAGTHYTTTVKIQCPQGKVIETHIHKLLSAEIACTTTIPAQTLNGTLTVKNMIGIAGHPTDLTLSGSINIPAIQHNKDSTLCGGKANETLESVYSYVISEANPLTITGTSHTKNENIGLDVSHP
jgi:hypothetical protein